MLEKTCGVVRKFGAHVNERALRVGVIGAAVLGPVMSFAQTSDPFTDAQTAAATKIALYGAGLVVTAGAAVVFMIGVKYVKKIPRAA